MKTLSSLFRFDDALIPNLIAWAYIFVTYCVGFVAMVLEPLWINLIGVLLLAHSMVIAAYFIHECAHDSVFKKRRHNRLFGEALLWICGTLYSDYDAIRHKHARHHNDRADIVSFDFRESLLEYPKILKIIETLEYFYIPAVEVMMHALILVLPFTKASRKQQRFRVSIVLFLRIVFFAALSSYSLHILWLTVMRFMDVNQHTYALYETLDQKAGKEVEAYDRAFESAHTYSNLISQSYPWLNLLVLNFGYHNVHHDQQIQPWYRLPRLHEELYGSEQKTMLPFINLVKSYHDNRVARVLNADPLDMDVKEHEGRHFIGVDGVSFLTAH